MRNTKKIELNVDRGGFLYQFHRDKCDERAEHTNV